MTTLTGGCMCGAVRFRIDAPLLAARYCHCTRCQHRTGAAASAGALTRPGSFAITAGVDRVRAWDPGDGGWIKWFCGGCGGQTHAQDPAAPDTIAVRLGAVDGDPGVRPGARQFVAYAAAWEPIPDDGLPRYPERAPV
jgi:hypothetical protein